MQNPRLSNRFVLAFILLLVFSPTVYCQLETATISGVITDQSGAIVVGAEVRVTNTDTNVTSTTTSNQSGVYLVTGLKPGRYRVHVAKEGFKGIDLTDLVLSVQDSISRNFSLQIGSISETISVEGGVSLINTTDASVGTVVDRKYVENMPLNGRSFQNLIELTPGVVTNSPQTSSLAGVSGEFSVNGQRTESNYYLVDGVGANLSVSTNYGAPGASGTLPPSTALGTTHGLVSVDALEEFRIQSSTYSAEYGRNPGAELSFATRSGTNEWHGTAFDYLRNNTFDANDWFNSYFGRPQAPLRQNDFGGTLGGAVRIPRVYNGKDKTFFFFSYEGLRLTQPQAAFLTYVPSAGLRSSAPAALQPVLNAFPVGNGRDLGTGLTEFTGTWSNPGSLDSTSVRLDQVVNDKLRLFFRFSNASSTADSRFRFNPSIQGSTANPTRTYTLGTTSSFSASLSNELRLNYSSNETVVTDTPGAFEGATPVNLFQLQGFTSQVNPVPQVAVNLILGGHVAVIRQDGFSGKQKQWNVVDTIALLRGKHQFKFGVDFRRLGPAIVLNSPVTNYTYRSVNSVNTNTVDSGVAASFAQGLPVYTNFSAFGQDEWKMTRRLNLSMGLRWEVNPAPSAPQGNLPYTVQGNSLGTLTLAPQGTPLWNTSWFNIAPRLGAAYILRDSAGWETVVRGGGGVFFDTGQQPGSLGYGGPGFSALVLFGQSAGSPASFPIPLPQASPAIVNPPVPRYGTVFAFPAHLQLPYTLQFNASMEQALGKAQSLSVSYVGGVGRRLLRQSQFNARSFNPNFTTILLSENGLTSDYDALQMQFKRRFARGIQALASYTWAHSIDYGSQNASLPSIRGNSDFDVRHNFSAAVSYDLPNPLRSGLAGAFLHHWGLDDRFTARTGFPVTVDGATITDPATGAQFHSSLNVNPGQPLYFYGSQCASAYNNGKGCPGGRAINPGAFSLPAGCTISSCAPGAGAGNAPRNFARGFGAWQMDVAVRRDFPIYERLRLQFRAEAFNVFNHPAFGFINHSYCGAAGPGCTFGQASSTLAQSLGTLNPVYQGGGPRSMQFALKLIF